MATTTCTEMHTPDRIDKLLVCNLPYLSELIWPDNAEFKPDRAENEKGIYPTKQDYLLALVAYLKKIKKNNYKVTVKYNESEHGGRQYSNGFSIQSMVKSVRGFIANNSFDYDIDNCHPTLLKKIAVRDCEDIDTSVLDGYLSNRQAVLSKYNLTKIEVIACMNKDNYRGKNEWLKKFHKEVKLIQEHVCRNTDITTDKPQNKKASILNKLLCIEENTILKKCIAGIKADNPSISIRALMFDGFMSNNGDLIDKLNMLSKEWNINWSIKPHNPLEYSEPPADKLNEKSYEYMKEEFERTHGFVKRPQPIFYSEYINQDGEDALSRWSSVELSTVYYNKYYENLVWDPKEKEYVTKSVHFLKTWTSDPTRKTFEKFDFLPPPHKVPSDTYNLFHGFLYEKYIDIEPDTDITDFIDLFRHLAGSEKKEEITEYMLNYFAHIIQYPGELPRTSVLYKSEEGLGKNVLFEGFGRNVLGDEYVLCAQRQEDIVGRFSITNGKFIVIWNEASGKDTHSSIEAIKTLVTEEKVSWEAKGRQTVTINNVSRLFFFTNNECPIKISPSNRRFMVIDCDAHKDDYSDNLCDRVRAAWANKAKVLGLVKFLKERDISKWDPCKDRVFTSFYDALSSKSVPLYDKFIINRLEDTGVSDEEELVKASVFYKEYTKWCKENEYAPQTQTAFSRKMILIDGINKRKSSTIFYAINTATVLEYMKTKKYVPEEQYLDILNGVVDLE
jgi:hypothetical protein